MTLAFGATNDPPAMRGSDGARDRLADFLLAALPVKTTLLRSDWLYDQGLLPDVGKISSGELPRTVISDLADAWIEIVNPRTLPGLRRVDITPEGDPVYQTRYACRIYVWARGEDWDNAMARRDNLTIAVRMALLEFATLAIEGGDTGWLVLEETWTEEFGVPTPVPNKSGRCWCSAVLSVDVRAEQQMSAGRMRKPIATVNNTIIAVGTVGPTDPLPEAGPAFIPGVDPTAATPVPDPPAVADPDVDVTSDQNLDPSS